MTIGRVTEAVLQPGATDRYTVAVRSPGSYTIDMGGEKDFDSHLRLSQGNREIASDDDGGDGLNARIQRRLEVGDYVIEASSADSGGAGPYRIGIQSR